MPSPERTSNRFELRAAAFDVDTAALQIPLRGTLVAFPFLEPGRFATNGTQQSYLRLPCSMSSLSMADSMRDGDNMNWAKALA